MEGINWGGGGRVTSVKLSTMKINILKQEKNQQDIATTPQQVTK